MSFVVNLKTFENVKKFNGIVSGFATDVDVVSGKYKVDAKSIMGLLSLNLSKPLTVVVEDEAYFADVKNALAEFAEQFFWQQ